MITLCYKFLDLNDHSLIMVWNDALDWLLFCVVDSDVNKLQNVHSSEEVTKFSRCVGLNYRKKCNVHTESELILYDNLFCIPLAQPDDAINIILQIQR